MQLYSSRPGQATWQAVGDVVAIGTIAAAVSVSQQVGAAISSLGAFGEQIETAGSGFSTTLGDAGEALAEVPFVGEGVAQPFRDASGSATDLAAAGTALSSAVDTLAATVATALWLLPVLLVVLLWIVPRLRFATRARATRALVRSQAGRDLLAMRALVGQPMAKVLRAVPDPVAALRTADEPAMRALAALELRTAGVRGEPM
ncbi:MAG: hypothetical protein ACQEWM_09415 [Actinomycetota bacterium]